MIIMELFDKLIAKLTLIGKLQLLAIVSAFFFGWAWAYSTDDRITCLLAMNTAAFVCLALIAMRKEKIRAKLQVAS